MPFRQDLTFPVVYQHFYLERVPHSLTSSVLSTLFSRHNPSEKPLPSGYSTGFCPFGGRSLFVGIVLGGPTGLWPGGRPLQSRCGTFHGWKPISSAGALALGCRFRLAPWRQAAHGPGFFRRSERAWARGYPRPSPGYPENCINHQFSGFFDCPGRCSLPTAITTCTTFSGHWPGSASATAICWTGRSGGFSHSSRNCPSPRRR